MPKITYVQPNGSSRSVEVAIGLSVMRGAVDHDLPGIRAECGGACACATCPVLIDPAWVDKIPAPAATELSMMDDETVERGMQRRLSCQINVTAAVDGLVVHIPF